MNSYSDAAQVLCGHIQTEPVGKPMTSQVRGAGDTTIKERRNWSLRTVSIERNQLVQGLTQSAWISHLSSLAKGKQFNP